MEGMRAPAPPTDSKAVVALVLGILSLVATFCWLGLPLGIPAIVFGALAHHDIRRSEGMSGGSGMATAGMVMGAVGSTVFLGWMGFLAYVLIHSSAVPTVASLPPPLLVPIPTSEAPLTQPGDWGQIHVVDLHASTKPLRAQLAEEAKAASAVGETLLVQTTAASCVACREIARSMSEPMLQSALADVRLVRLDVSEVGGELAPLHMRQPALPWFYLVDAHGSARDGISADEWDDNDAESLAPVLEAFVHGRLQSRRHPWEGTLL
jgi:hypothetical protein